MFNRLELKEILANLGPDCEPEVVDKIRGMLGKPSERVYVEPAHTTTIPPVTWTNDTILPRVSGPMLMTSNEIDALRAVCEKNGQTLTQADVDTINAERVAAWNNQQRMSKAISYEPFTRPEIPGGAGIEHVPLGGINSRGEKCIALDGQSGCSVFECRNGHAYVNNNPNIRGCTQCYMEGEREPAVAAVVVDDGAIEGEESRW